MANNKTCKCCGTKYTYCNSCPSDKTKPAWMNIYCSDNGRTLFRTATDYFAGNIKKEDVKKIVDKVDLSNMAKFDKGVVKMINEVKTYENNSFEKSVKDVNKNVDVKNNVDVKKIKDIKKNIDKVDKEKQN